MKANSLKADGSGGQDLREHLLAVGNVAKEMAHKDLKDMCKFAGDWHDVGKATEGFQDCLIKAYPEWDEKSKYKGPLHHEVSWAILNVLTSKDPAVSQLKESLSAVYFHHVTPCHRPGVDFKDARSIIEYLKKREKGSLEGCLALVEDLREKSSGDCILWTKVAPTADFDKLLVEFLDETRLAVPSYGVDPRYCAEKSARFLAVRSLLVTADRYVSKMSNDQCAKAAISFTLPPEPRVSFADNLVLGSSERDLKQQNIVDTLLNHPSQVSEINELTGFGKTRIALLHFAKSKSRQLIFLVPRSSLAQDRYTGLKKEMSALGIAASIESIYSGGRQECSHPGIEPGDCDIVVSTVDSYLLAQIKHGRSYRFTDTLSSMLVFDEYQEVVCDSALFAASVVLLRSRCSYATAPTVVMSATPMPIWEYTRVDPSNICKIKVDYNQDSLLIPMTLIEKGEVGTPMFGEITYVNSVATSQAMYKDSEESIFLAHARYTTADKKKMMTQVLENYSGKHNVGLVSTSILQSGVDISFDKMTLLNPTPSAIVQCIGRYDRKNEGTGKGVDIFCIPHASENAARNITKEICDAFLEQLFKDSNRVSITRAKLHEAYAEFSNSTLMCKHISVLWDKSCTEYSEIRLGRGADFEKPEDKEVSVGGSNQLRGGSEYYTMRDPEGKLLGKDEVLSFFVDDKTSRNAAAFTDGHLRYNWFKQETREAGLCYKKRYGTFDKYNSSTPIYLDSYVYHRKVNGERGMGAMKIE